MAIGPWRFREDSDTGKWLDIRSVGATGDPFANGSIDIDPLFAVADVYKVTLSAVDNTAHTATVTVTSAGGTGINPFVGAGSAVFTGVPLVGTLNWGLIPGVGIPFVTSPLANGQSAYVYVGLIPNLLVSTVPTLLATRAGNPNATQFRYTTTTPANVSVATGDPGAIWKIRAYNVDTFARTGASLVLYPSPVVLNLGTPAAFKSLEVTTNDPVQKSAGDGTIKPYHNRFTDNGDGTWDWEIEPYPFGTWRHLALRDVTGAANVTGAAVIADGTNIYQVRDGVDAWSDDLANIRVVLDTTVDDTSTPNLVIVAKGYLWLASDIGGAIPTVWTLDRIPITGPGRPSGSILPSTYSLAWLKLDVPAAASANVNIWTQKPIAEADNTGMTDWLG